jgi:hypothetical protein
LGCGDGFEVVGGEGGVDVAGFCIAGARGVGQDLEGIVTFRKFGGQISMAAVGKNHAELVNHS